MFNKLNLYLLTTLILLTSCGYTIQGKQALPFEDIYIGEIKNTTYEPRLQDKMTSILTDVFRSYGFYIRKDARFRLEGDITRFNLSVLSEISLTASEYQVDILGDFRLIDRETQKVYPIMILRPFLTHFTTKQKMTDLLIQKEQYTNSALREIAQEIVREIIYHQGKIK